MLLPPKKNVANDTKSPGAAWNFRQLISLAANHCYREQLARP